MLTLATLGRQIRSGGRLHALVAVAAAGLLLLPGLWLVHGFARSAAAGVPSAEPARAVQRAGETVRSTLKDVELAQRGYLLTGDPADLKTYTMARARLDAGVARLTGAAAAAPEWATIARRIRSLAADEAAALDHAIGLYQSGRTDAARTMAVRGDDQRTGDAIDAELGALRADASASTENARRQAAIPALAAPAGLAIGGALLLGYLALTRRRARRAADAPLPGYTSLDQTLGLLPGILRHPDGRIIAWGPGAERLYGYPAAEAIGEISHVLLRTTFPVPLAEIQAALRRDGQWRGELVHRRRDGTTIAVVTSWTLRPAGRHGPDLVVEMCNDVTALWQAEAAVRASEERLRAATAAAGVGLVLVNRAHRYRFANEAYADILDLPSPDIVGQRVADVLTPMYADQIRPRLERAFEGERVVYELVKPAVPGRQGERHYTVTYELSRIATDEPVVVVVITEITGRVAAMRALEDRERTLQLALEASELGIWRCEAAQTGAAPDWDARCKAIFGFPPDQPVTVESWKNAVPAEHWDSVEAALHRALSPDDPQDDCACDYPVVHRDGTRRWVAAVGRAFFQPDRGAPSGRRVVRIIGTMRDVTRARQEAQERQRNNELLQTILTTAPGLIYAKDQAGRYLVANPPVLALFGKTLADIQGRTDRQIFGASAEAEALMQADRRVMAAGNAEVMEELFGEDDGQPRVWLSTKTPLRCIDGSIAGTVGVSLEITERKRFQSRLQLMVHELNHRVKNTLATVQAIAANSLRDADGPTRRTFESRLLALAAAHDVLTRESWTGASMDEVVASALAPFGGAAEGRFRVAGPPVRLVPRAALALSMGLHELATNAAKYGALMGEAGTVTMRWLVCDGCFRLDWSEQGGPAVLPPARRGFGTRLVERGIARDLGGTAVLSFEPGGVCCVIRAPLESIASSAQILRLPNVGGRANGR